MKMYPVTGKKLVLLNCTEPWLPLTLQYSGSVTLPCLVTSDTLPLAPTNPLRHQLPWFSTMLAAAADQSQSQTVDISLMKRKFQYQTSPRQYSFDPTSCEQLHIQ